MKRILIGVCALVIPLAAGTTAARTPSTPPIASKSATSHIQLALLLDTSSSMDGLINQARTQLWKIVTALSTASKHGVRAELEIALYEYGNDNLAVKAGWIRQVMPFTEDLDAVSERLFELYTNGGTELCPTVVKTSVDELQWGSERSDLRMIVIAGNEDFQQGKILAREACKAAQERDISITALYCGAAGSVEATAWKDAAICGGGGFAAINTQDEIAYVETPFDTTLQRLNMQLNDTYVGYGELGAAKKRRQSNEDRKASGVHASVLSERAMAKASKAYKNTDWDIVDKYTADSTAVLDMAPSAMPAEVRKLDKNGREKWVRELSAKRNTTQKQIADITAKRNTFVANASKKRIGKDQTMDTALIKAIMELATRKQFTFASLD